MVEHAPVGRKGAHGHPSPSGSGCRMTDGFAEEDRDVAHIFAKHAAVALSRARDTANLWKAIDARQRIGQAQGILMERFSIDADHAFAVLRR